MKKKTEKISIYRTVISAALVVAAILSMAACAPVTGPEVIPPPAGKGIVNIQLGVNEPGLARTLIPGSVTAGAFDAYDLGFTVVADGGSGTAQSFSNVASLTAALDPGKYDLVLTAKKSGTTVAEGSYKNITVTNGGTASVSVPLVFKAGAGDGTLKFTVTRPEGIDLTDAQFTLAPLHSGGTSYGTDWLKIMYTGEKKVTHSSNETIASGYYQATVTLSTAERKAVKSDIVHIGAGQTTTLNWTFAEADFSTIVTDIWLLGVNNEWQTYGVANKLTQTANGTFVWEGEMSHEYFRFSLEPTTGWPNDKDRPNRFQPAGNDVTISFDTPVDMTYVPKNTDPVTAWNLGGAGYYKFVVDPYEKTVVVTKPTAVTGVVINGGNVTLNKGTSNAFTAVVNGHNTPSQAVTWSITSGHVAGMAFSGNTLTIDSAETASTLTVRATSTADLTKYGEITVTVQEAAAPVVTSIVVTSAGNAAEVSRSGTLQFSKTVTASNGATEDVTWSVSGKDKNGASYSFTSSIDTNGLLTVDENEAAVDLVVRATSRESGYTNIYGEATVFVRKYNDIYAIGDDFSNGWNTATSGSKMTYDGRGVYKLTDILLTKAHTFKFRDSTPTDWNNGNWFHAGTATDDDKTIGDKWVGVRNSSGDNSWKVTHGGKYTITLNTGSMVVAFESTKQVITITGGPSALAPGENGTFTYTTTITGASAPVTWNVYGDGVDRHVPQNNTDVSNGFLTLGSGEWIGHKLFVTVTSLGETVESKQYPVLAVPIIDPEVYIAGDMSNWNDGTKMERGTTPATLHLFTWAGSLSTDCYFRMYRGPGISGNDKPWFTPPTDDAYGINSGHCINLSVVRWDNSGTTNRNWKITPWGDGQYTITFNAADRTLDVTKN